MFFLDFNHILHYIHKNVNSYKDQISITHAHKLYNLSAFYKSPNVDRDTVITRLIYLIGCLLEKKNGCCLLAWSTA